MTEFNQFLSFIAGAVFTPLIMWAVSYYAKRHRVRRDETTGGVILEYPTSWKVMSAALLILGCGMVLMAWVIIGIKEPEDPYIFAALLLFFGGIGGALVIETFKGRVIVSENDVLAMPAWSRPRSISWDKIKELKYSSGMGWFTIASHTGIIIRVPVYFCAIDVLEQEVRHRLHPKIYQYAEEGFVIARKGAVF